MSIGFSALTALELEAPLSEVAPPQNCAVVGMPEAVEASPNSGKVAATEGELKAKPRITV